MLELELVKEHCRLEPDFSADDKLVNVFIGAARKHVEMYTRRTLYASASDPGYEDDEDHLLLDDDVRTAMLLCIGHWYANREAAVVGASASKLPLAVDALLQPYRIYGL
ncbi:head-tail connector protein [Serratia odorifera]|uniref:Phage gp6-like head-tail connector protein n=2 Tax=Serratia odorifera TaxID=618 RepID=A0A3S4DT65_SEROD|nr:head-tail connector protein [Serratia odorifera]EFE93957.1 putative phage DNA packaging protein [Serratia odorifera DSM 4582]PNK88843.1 phage gp6-like head-tail connector protein [Serratia odorifera]RII69808.1 phage gp6-like head-tail connector protein [Serratia odorifera]VDZ64774.1 Phage gp6-like head-tail connector protein [Serratia odorifera]